MIEGQEFLSYAMYAALLASLTTSGYYIGAKYNTKESGSGNTKVEATFWQGYVGAVVGAILAIAITAAVHFGSGAAGGEMY